MKIGIKGVVIAVVFASLVAVASYYFISLPQSDIHRAVDTLSDDLFGWKFPVAKFPDVGSRDLAYSDIRDPGGLPQGLPVRLRIPAIGVDSAIEDALITPDGRMDVPSGSVNVAWFALGPQPGQTGSAVIGGHFGIKNGVPFVFYNLDQLQAGDKVYILDDNGDNLAFVVRFIRLFDRDADATEVFTSDDGLAHLNLITCEGIWNRVNGTYPERRVVFTDAVSDAEAMTEAQLVAKASAAAFPRTLSLGARGTDVATLQKVLETKKFFTMPRGVAYGFFGALTRNAVSKYQVSVGLPANGVFGASTIAKLTAATPPAVVKLALPTTYLETPVSADSPQVFTSLQLVKSLFGTPVDGLVTSVLLAVVLFLTFKIIRRKTSKKKTAS